MQLRYSLGTVNLKDKVSEICHKEHKQKWTYFSQLSSIWTESWRHSLWIGAVSTKNGDNSSNWRCCHGPSFCVTRSLGCSNFCRNLSHEKVCFDPDGIWRYLRSTDPNLGLVHASSLVTHVQWRGGGGRDVKKYGSVIAVTQPHWVRTLRLFDADTTVFDAVAYCVLRMQAGWKMVCPSTKQNKWCWR